MLDVFAKTLGNLMTTPKSLRQKPKSAALNTVSHDKNANKRARSSCQ